MVCLGNRCPRDIGLDNPAPLVRFKDPVTNLDGLEVGEGETTNIRHESSIGLLRQVFAPDIY